MDSDDECYKNEDTIIEFIESEIPKVVNEWHEMLMYTQSTILKDDYVRKRFAPTLCNWITQYIEPINPEEKNNEDDHEQEQFKKTKVKHKYAYAHNQSSHKTHYPKRTSNGK